MMKVEASKSMLEANAVALQKELEWFQAVLNTRFQLYFGNQPEGNGVYNSIFDIPLPDHSGGESMYSQILTHYNMNLPERLVLILALTPHVCPQLLDIFYTKNERYGRGFTEFGGVKGRQHGGFIPTGETAAFILAGTDLSLRFQVLQIFDPDHFFSKHKILNLEKDRSNEPLLSGVLSITREYLSYLTTGESYKPTFSMEFPAEILETKLTWDDLVLDAIVLEEVEEILVWIKYAKTIMEEWNLERIIKPGYRSLFYGPPGTGKTLTATLLGKTTNLDVYRVDLSKIVSKYIGETEKNLANIFDQAEFKSWILFFDEADALFGKRTNTTDAKDRYANQEVAYLLQRIESFPGVVILATNLKSNLDEAFARRFQSMVYFPMPRPEQRMQLWKSAFKNFELDEQIDLWKLSNDYEMSGGAIVNVLRYCALMAVEREEEKKFFLADILAGIRKELRKEGKTL